MRLYHLFPDLMNLYGDYGNLAVLKKALEDAGENAEIVPVHPGEAADFSDADFLYMGPGTEPARDVALTHLHPLSDALREAVLTRQVPALFTGNAWSVLGKTITRSDGSTVGALGLFDYATAESKTRYTGDAIAVAAPGSLLPQQPCVGFLNRCDRVDGVETPLFTLQMGKGNGGEPLTPEGFHQNNLFATHLIGPLLVKNPHLLNWFVTRLGATSQPLDETSHPVQAYQITLTALQARIANQH